MFLIFTLIIHSSPLEDSTKSRQQILYWIEEKQKNHGNFEKCTFLEYQMSHTQSY